MSRPEVLQMERETIHRPLGTARSLQHGSLSASNTQASFCSQHRPHFQKIWGFLHLNTEELTHGRSDHSCSRKKKNDLKSKSDSSWHSEHPATKHHWPTCGKGPA